MSREDVWRAVIRPGPLMSDQISCSSAELQVIALLRTLQSAGVAQEELYGLCDALQEGSGSAQKIARLRRIRFQLLARLHEQQKALDDLDSYVEALKGARMFENGHGGGF